MSRKDANTLKKESQTSSICSFVFSKCVLQWKPSLYIHIFYLIQQYFQMKLALFGLFALFGSATALKIHKVSHRQDATEVPPPETSVADAQGTVLTKFDKDGDGLGQKQFKKFVKKGGGSANDAQEAFKKLDTDGNGIISKQELAKLEQVATQQKAELSPIQQNPVQVPAA